MDETINESFDEYITSLVALKEAINGMRDQNRKTNRAIEKLLGSTHINSVLSMTGQVDFLNRIRPSK